LNTSRLNNRIDLQSDGNEFPEGKATMNCRTPKRAECARVISSKIAWRREYDDTLTCNKRLSVAARATGEPASIIRRIKLKFPFTIWQTASCAKEKTLRMAHLVAG